MSAELVVPVTAVTAGAAGDDEQYAAATSIIFMTQYVKQALPDSWSRIFPLIPLALSVAWAWADAKNSSPVVDWSVVLAKGFRVFVTSVGLYATGKQALPKKDGAAQTP